MLDADAGPQRRSAQTWRLTANQPLAAHLTEVARAFEALQRGITTLMNDVDGRAISELGRR